MLDSPTNADTAHHYTQPTTHARVTRCPFVPSTQLAALHPTSRHQLECQRDRQQRMPQGPGRLADLQLGAAIDEVVRRDLEVERGRAHPNTRRGVVVRTMARAKPATLVVAGVGNRNTAQVGANTQHHQNLLLDVTSFIRLGIAERLPIHLHASEGSGCCKVAPPSLS